MSEGGLREEVGMRRVRRSQTMTWLGGISVWLDDERPAPYGWTRVETSADCIALLQTGNVGALSLDHDLGGDDTGYRVVCWLEEHAANGGDVPQWLAVHSANPVGRARMEQGIASIQRIVERRAITEDEIDAEIAAVRAERRAREQSK